MRLDISKTIPISTRILNKQHFFEEWSRPGPYEVHYSIAGEEITLSLERSLETGDRWVRFISLSCSKWPEKKILNQQVGIDFTPCHFGGRRWWFLCLLPKDGQRCMQRVGVLYFPWAGDSPVGFGCRCCHRLRYPVDPESTREQGRTMMREIRKIVTRKLLFRRYCEDCGTSLAIFDGVKGVAPRSKLCPVCQEIRHYSKGSAEIPLGDEGNRKIKAG